MNEFWRSIAGSVALVVIIAALAWWCEKMKAEIDAHDGDGLGGGGS